MVSANGVINNKVGASISGVTNTFTVTNPSNTASSAARETITVGGGTAADPSLNFNVSGVTDWEIGIDNSDSDKWKLSQGTALGTNDTFISTTSGQITMPLTPAFLAYVNTSVANVTGDATAYIPIFNVENFDQNSNYNTATGIFTAPITGRYYLATTLNVTNINAAHNSYLISILINATQYRFMECNSANARSTTNSAGFSGSLIVDMTAGDTAKAQVSVQSSTKTITLRGKDGGADILSFFSGQLMC